MAMAKAEGIYLPKIKAEQRYVVHHTHWVEPVIEHAAICLPLDSRFHVIG